MLRSELNNYLKAGTWKRSTYGGANEEVRKEKAASILDKLKGIQITEKPGPPEKVSKFEDLGDSDPILENTNKKKAEKSIVIEPKTQPNKGVKLGSSANSYVDIGSEEEETPVFELVSEEPTFELVEDF